MAARRGGATERGEAEATGDGCPPVAKALCVLIPGPPVAQGRPRFVFARGIARAYDPKQSRMWKRVASTLIRAERLARGVTFVGPVEVVIVAARGCPENDKRKRVPAPRHWDTSHTGDADNIAKAVLDSCTTAGLWADDAQVSRLVVERWIAAQDEPPSVLIEVRAL